MINWKLLTKSFGYAFEGIQFAWSNDQNFRIHIIVAIFVFLIALLLRLNPFEFSIIIIMIVLVITAEMINTSIEKMTDLITKEHHQEAKFAKDVSSAMVLVAVIGSVIVGLVIFTPYLLALADSVS